MHHTSARLKRLGTRNQVQAVLLTSVWFCHNLFLSALRSAFWLHFDLYLDGRQFACTILSPFQSRAPLAIISQPTAYSNTPCTPCI
ncbi:Uncharacterized protein HZ326_14931 [Fusarium oxysporum f. sp. albedinis]|nr:Uncharacterized protein HZ326_14931 [Fusarium oxysporum f. sp. albedinis]